MLNVIKTALASSTAKIGVTTNNIANVGTTGFKRSEALFQDIYLTGGNPNGPKPGSGSKLQINRVTHHPAELKRTGVSSDLGISGWGMFMLGKPHPSKPGELEGEVNYTRNGSFQLDLNGFLTSDDGYYVLSKDSKPVQSAPLSMFFRVFQKCHFITSVPVSTHPFQIRSHIFVKLRTITRCASRFLVLKYQSIQEIVSVIIKLI